MTAQWDVANAALLAIAACIVVALVACAIGAFVAHIFADDPTHPIGILVGVAVVIAVVYVGAGLGVLN